MEGHVTSGSPEEEYYLSGGHKRCGCCCGAVPGEIFRAGDIKCFPLEIPVNAMYFTMYEQAAKRFKEDEKTELLSEVNINHESLHVSGKGQSS